MTCPGSPMIFQGQEFLQPGEFNDWRGLNWSNAIRNEKIVNAYKKLIELRKNKLKNTGGLTGPSCNLIHFNDENKVIAYHRWNSGGSGDDVVVIVNFSNKSFENYSLNLPNDGQWNVRFCSSDREYMKESKDDLTSVHISKLGALSLFLPASSAIILSQ